MRTSPPFIRRMTILIAAAALTALTACGDDDAEAAEAASEASPTTTEAPPPESTISTTTLPPGVDLAPISCANLDPCRATARVPDPLEDGSIVVVTIDGWGPNQFVGVAQCADPAAYPAGEIALEASGLNEESSCHLPGFQRVRSDDDGRVVIEHEVAAGDRMRWETQAAVTCDAARPCVLNVFAADQGRFNANNPRVVFRLEFP